MHNQDTVVLLQDKIIKFLIFQVGEIHYGIDILKIEGINWVPAITPVFSAPSYVKGLLNLRGQLVTVFDLAIRLGLQECQLSKKSRIIILKLNMEYVGLLVDSVIEVVASQEKFVEPPPANASESQRAFFSGILKRNNSLTTIIDVDEIIKVEE